MIIQCINCNKKFEVNSDLIPAKGRNIQCGSCSHIWFFLKSYQNHENPNTRNEKKTIITQINDNINNDDDLFNETQSSSNNDTSKIIKKKSKSNFSIGKLLSLILVLIISFFALIILLDTFKTFLYDFFPNLEFFLFSLFETLKDIKLFFKDLI